MDTADRAIGTPPRSDPDLPYAVQKSPPGIALQSALRCHLTFVPMMMLAVYGGDLILPHLLMMRTSLLLSALLGLGAMILCGPAGCVDREVTVNSTPQGALVYLNGQEVGRTPLTKEFTFYGTYDVAVRKEGYETIRTTAPVIAPWWQWIPVDLLAELVPVPLTDEHKLHYDLQPLAERTVDPDRLVHRGERFREELRGGVKPPREPKTKPAKKFSKPDTIAPTTLPATQPQ